MMILIRDRNANQFEDKTPDVSRVRPAAHQIEILFNGKTRPYTYGQDHWHSVRAAKRPACGFAVAGGVGAAASCHAA
jgi:hypothetical protein